MGTTGHEDKRTEFTQSEQQAENRPKKKRLRDPWDDRRATFASLGSQEEGASGTEKKKTPEETMAEIPKLGKRHKATASRR